MCTLAVRQDQFRLSSRLLRKRANGVPKKNLPAHRGKDFSHTVTSPASSTQLILAYRSASAICAGFCGL
jgi:hypothetical protein